VSSGSEARRGRPRSAGADERIIRVAIELLLARGYGGLSPDEVAERAGVAKTTLYRRWPSKGHLALAVVARLQEYDEIPDTGDIRRDLTVYLGEIAVALNRMRLAGAAEGSRSPGTVAELVAAAARDDELDRLRRELYERRNALAIALIERAVRRGQLRPDLDPGVLLEQLAGALYYRVLITGAPVDEEYAARLVASALDGATTAE